MLKKQAALKKRDLYLNQLIAFRDTEPVKVVTGIRRCGKSSLLKLMMQHLRENGVTDNQMVSMNFESMDYRGMSVEDVYAYVKERIVPDQRMYLFFDEIQRVTDWQDAVNSFRVDFDCDIYITGSNAYLLSSEISTYLSGRYVEIRMLPLSFKEFLDFHEYRIAEYKSPVGEIRKRVMDEEGNVYELKELFEAYMRFGGMPGIADVGLEQDKAWTLLDGVYNTVVVRDILERDRRRGQRQITDAELLRKIVLYLADNIGNSTSATTISNTLVSKGMLTERKRAGTPAVQTIQAYVAALLESYIFYEIKRFDIKGKGYLSTLGKYYIVDTGLRNFLLGYRNMDVGHAIENIVYFELLRRGYDVAVGKVGDREVDFIATKVDDKRYFQVTENMDAESTRIRELEPLRQIRDSFEKNIIVLDSNTTMTQDGIKIIRLLDFLLE